MHGIARLQELAKSMEQQKVILFGVFGITVGDPVFLANLLPSTDTTLDFPELTTLMSVLYAAST
jgi:hypothetical protein